MACLLIEPIENVGFCWITLLQAWIKLPNSALVTKINSFLIEASVNSLLFLLKLLTNDINKTKRYIKWGKKKEGKVK